MASSTSKEVSASSDAVASSHEKDRGLAEQRPGDGNPLPLAAGEAGAVFSAQIVRALFR